MYSLYFHSLTLWTVILCLFFFCRDLENIHPILNCWFILGVIFMSFKICFKILFLWLLKQRGKECFFYLLYETKFSTFCCLLSCSYDDNWIWIAFIATNYFYIVCQQWCLMPVFFVLALFMTEIQHHPLPVSVLTANRFTKMLFLLGIPWFWLTSVLARESPQLFFPCAAMRVVTFSETLYYFRIPFFWLYIPIETRRGL